MGNACINHELRRGVTAPSRPWCVLTACAEPKFSSFLTSKHPTASVWGWEENPEVPGSGYCVAVCPQVSYATSLSYAQIVIWTMKPSSQAAVARRVKALSPVSTNTRPHPLFLFFLWHVGGREASNMVSSLGLLL